MPWRRFFGRSDREHFPWFGRVFQHRSVRPASAVEVDEEIDDHLERAVRQLVQEGLRPEEARREALRRFGDLEKYRRRLRALNRRRGRREAMRALLETLWMGARDAVRGIRTSPGVAATVVGTLALGIGANATMFGVIDRLLLSPPPGVTAADSLVQLYGQRRWFNGRVITTATFAYPDYVDFQGVDAFAGVAAYGNTVLTLGEGIEATQVTVQKATPSFFRVLGTRPAFGRFFTDEEDTVGSAGVVVLGYELWQRRFGGDRGILGRRVKLGGAEHEIVGVAPRAFNGVGLQRIDLWVPLRTPAEVPPAVDVSVTSPLPWEESRSWYFLQVVARLRPGVAPAAAEAQATAAHRAGRAEMARQGNYDPEARIFAGSIIPGRGPNAPAEARVAQWLGGVAAIVLLIACANVANILLARGMQRRREIGVRLALGIGARRLALQLLAEGLLLALLGAVAALGLAYFGSLAVRGVLLPEVDWSGTPPLSLRVLAFTGVAALLTGVLAGLAPALHAARQDVMELLAGGARGGVLQRSRLRTGMLVAQTTLSVLLLVGAGLFVRSLARVRGLDLGFEPDNVLMVVPDLERTLEESPQRRDFVLRALERVQRLPAVRGAAASWTAPFYSSMSTDLDVPDVPEPPELEDGGPYILSVTDGYFDTMGVRIVRGRGFTADDDEGAPLVAVVEETMARLYWPGQDPLGKCLKVGGAEAECSTVVGVAEDSARQSLRGEDTVQYYVAARQRQRAPRVLFVRVEAPAPEVTEQIRREVLAAAPGVRYVNVQPLRELIDPHTRSWRLGATMFTAFGALALAIAAVGLYGVLAFMVAQRSHEIGVRSALGADRHEIVALVLRQAMGLVGGSVLLGLAAAAGLGRWLEPLLFEVSPYDPLVFVTVAATLLAVAVVASGLPARRAAAVDPAVALREE